MAQQQLQIGKFLINKKKLIGKGQFGLVFQAIADDEIYCVKIIQKQPNYERFVLREIEILNRLRFSPIPNPNLVHTFEISEDPTKNDIYIVMEFCKDGDLQKDIQTRKKNRNWYTHQESVNIIAQIVRGYKSLYDLNFLHRDIKPANILISSGFYKLADFGMGRFIGYNTITQVGTPSYTAPQVYFSKTYSNKCDVYSLGVVFYELIFQMLPISGKSSQELLQKLQKSIDKEIQCPNQENLDLRIKVLIEQMLRYNEENRISWPDLFNHPLFNGQSLNSTNHARRASLLVQIQSERFQKRQQIPFYHHSIKSYNSKEECQGFEGLRHLTEFLMTKGDVAYDLATELSTSSNGMHEDQLNILLYCLISYKYFVCLNVMGICTNQSRYCHKSLKEQLAQFSELTQTYSTSQEPDCQAMRGIIQAQLGLLNNYFRDCEEQIQQIENFEQKYSNFYGLIEEQAEADFSNYLVWFSQFYNDWFKNLTFPTQNLINKILQLENVFPLDKFWRKSPAQIIRIRTNSL